MDEQRRAFAITLLAVAKIAVIFWYSLAGLVAGVFIWGIGGFTQDATMAAVLTGVVVAAWKVASEWNETPAILLRLSPRIFAAQPPQKRQDSAQ